jgi:ribonuclease HI
MSFRLTSDDSPEPIPTSGKQSLLIANVDGGARGNPGPAGYGVFIEDDSGRPVAELSEYLGHKTNNYAEYSGLLAALSYALDHGAKALRVISDSELMVKQIKGQYKVNSPSLKDLHGEAKRLIRQLERFEIRHVLREKNVQADRLANMAMDKGMGKTTSTPAATQTALTTTTTVERNGVVRDGVVQFMGNPLPEGTLVKVRAVKS